MHIYIISISIKFNKKKLTCDFFLAVLLGVTGTPLVKIDGEWLVVTGHKRKSENAIVLPIVQNRCWVPAIKYEGW